jgi:hypothetical protein
MELVIKDIKTAEDLKLISGLAKRLGLKTAKLTAEEREDIGMYEAIRRGRQSGYVSEDEVMSVLSKIQRTK